MMPEPRALDTLQTPSLVLHRKNVPAPGKPRLIFINSLGCDLRIWAAVTKELSGHFDITVYDKRGHGLSDIGTPPYTLEDHAGDLLALIAEGGAPAFVCGLSIGGMIAIAAALERPDLVSGLVLCDTAARIGSAARYSARAADIRSGGMEAFADTQMTHWFSARFRQARPDVVGVMRNMLVRQPVTGYLGSVATLKDADLSDRIGAIATPTLCLVGSEDASTPPAAVAALAAGIPNAQFAVIDGAGHLPCIEAPGEFSRLVSRFIGKLT